QLPIGRSRSRGRRSPQEDLVAQPEPRGVVAEAREHQGHADRLQHVQLAIVVDLVAAHGRAQPQPRELARRKALGDEVREAHVDANVEICGIGHVAVGVELRPADLEGIFEWHQKNTSQATSSVRNMPPKMAEKTARRMRESEACCAAASDGSIALPRRRSGNAMKITPARIAMKATKTIASFSPRLIRRTYHGAPRAGEPATSGTDRTDSWGTSDPSS